MQRGLPAAATVAALAALCPAQEGADERRAETPEERVLLDHANVYRGALALAALDRDDELSWHCLRHARYLDRNNQRGHDEDPTLPGYSDEGRAAGSASILAFLAPERSVDQWMDTFLHRIPVITPTGARAGVAWLAGSAVTSAALDTRRGADTGRGRDAVVTWPPDGMVGVPTRMNDEIPNPTPYTSADQAGYPVTCTFHPARRVTGASATLWLGTTPVPGFFSSPSAPTHVGAAYQQNTICLIPEKPLPHSKAFRVEMAATVDGKAWRTEWRFTTGNRSAGIDWLKRRRETLAAESAATAGKAAREKIRDEKEAKRACAVAVGVLAAVPEKGLANAIRDARETRAVLPEAFWPELDAALRTADKRLTGWVDAQLATARAARAAGETAKAEAALAAADALANGLEPWKARVAAARAAGGGASAPASSAAKPEAGWQTLLTDKLDKAWTGPVAHAGHLKYEDGGVHLLASQDPVSIAYLYFTDDWTDYEVKAEVQVTSGAALVLRAHLASGEYKGHYVWLNPTKAGEWVTLHATISGTTVRVTCGDQVVSETCDAGKGGLIFCVQPDAERLKVKNVRVRK